MFGSDFLDVGIGMVMLFAFVSLVCTAAREGLEGILKQRAMDLERGVRELLGDHDGQGLAKVLLNHPLICSLFAGRYDPDKLKTTTDWFHCGQRAIMPLARRRALPSYIPASNFSAAVIDLVARGASGLRQPPVIAAAEALTIDNLRASAGRLPDGSLKTALVSAIDHAGNDLDAVKTSLESWFNATMDRVSGWYKRRTQMILFAIGLAAAGILNIDSITVAQQLYDNKLLREQVLAQASRQRAAAQSQPVSEAATRGETDAPVAPLPGFEQMRAAIDVIDYPIGWPAPQAMRPGCLSRQDAACFASFASPSNWGLLPRMVLGWLITALATMLGAPFWFDILNRLMVVRSTVKPHEKSPEEASQDLQ